jgi:hypothetical protein
MGKRVQSIAGGLSNCLVKKPRGKKSAVGVDFAPSISICSSGLFFLHASLQIQLVYPPFELSHT